MNDQFFWHLARASGMVAWAILTLSMVWGMFLSTRILQDRRRPAWLLDLHRWLGGLSVFFVAVHLSGLVLDNYVDFGIADLLVPFHSSWHPVAVAWGVVGLYLVVAIQATSLAMKRLPRRWWRGIHLTSFALFWIVSIHAAFAGTDATAPWYRITSTVMIVLVMVVTLYRVLTKTAAGPRRRRGVPETVS